MRFNINPNDSVPSISYTWKNSTSTNVVIARCSTSLCPSIGSTQTVRSGITGSFADVSTDITSAGLPFMSFEDNIGGTISCGNNTCSSGNTVTTNTGFDYSSTLINTDTYPLVVGYQSAAGIGVLKCADALCSTSNYYNPLTNSQVTGSLQYVPMIISNNNLPLFAYINNNNRLAVYRCTNISCNP
jgi:hypothetical protein